MLSQYQLSSILRGHTQDVKDLVTIDNNKIASVSRDGDVRVWSKDGSDNGSDPWESTTIYSNSHFLNSICYDKNNKVLFYGGKDCLINGHSIFATLGETSEPLYTFVGHSSNVCSLNIYENELISGSWDATAKIWSNGVCKYTLSGHRGPVWGAKILPGNNNHFITVAADKIIRLWETDSILKEFKNIHNDVIRDVEILNDEGTLFATCSNDSTIKIFDFTGNIIHVLEGHESFVYKIKFNKDTNQLISCGEDRSLRIWNLDIKNNYKPSIIQVIRLPAISLWCCDFLPDGDIVVGSSDNNIYIFTKNELRLAPKQEMKTFQKDVESTALNSTTMGFDESKISPYDILQTKGHKEGHLVVVRAPTGVLEAHQYSNESWTKVGDVVGSSSVGSDKKKEYEGKMYDYIFDVDIEEGKPPLKLALNVTDNPYDVADNFIIRHELPSDYREQIVQFIIKNATGITLDNVQATSNQSTVSSQSTYIHNQMKVLPVKTYLTMKSCKTESIFNGIVKLNIKEKTFNDEDLALIGTSLENPNDNYEILYDITKKIFSSWTNKLPSFDIIRLIVDKLPDSNNILDYIKEGLDNKDINITMLTVRILVNCFNNKAWGIKLMSSSDVYKSVFETIDTVYPGATLRQLQTLGISVATLLLNYSSLVVQDNADPKSVDIVPVLADAINNKYGVLEEYQTSEEAAYRLTVAYGNLSTVEPTLRQFSKSVVWLNQIRRRYTNIPRFNDIFKDLEIA